MTDIISLNAGDYWIGDPRYAFDDESTISSLIKEAEEKGLDEPLFKSGNTVVAHGNFHHDGAVFIGGASVHEINITTGLVVIVPKSNVAEATRTMGVTFTVENTVNVAYNGQSSISVGNLLTCSPKSIDQVY